MHPLPFYRDHFALLRRLTFAWPPLARRLALLILSFLRLASSLLFPNGRPRKSDSGLLLPSLFLSKTS